MYHYVRPLRLTAFPEIKGLDLSLFREQLQYLRRHYEFISGADLLGALQGGGNQWNLPRNALMLTFDDGYADHYQYVFPILDEMQIPACFFPPASVVLDRCLLDVNRIHFVLASTPDKKEIITAIFAALDKYRAEFDISSNDALYDELASPSSYDTAEVTFIKRLLQVALPEGLRARICRELFARYVSTDEQAFAQELYMTLEQLRCMHRHGMYVGSHGDRHVWMNQIDAGEQRREIDRSGEMLKLVGTPTDSWIMCYPYGESNQLLREVLRDNGCRVGLTTVLGVASGHDDPLLMPRLDTNDLPKVASAPPNIWTKHVLVGDGPTPRKM
jgi:peptidoglycan/xylan/chitin deacetylase (PgdA/CDA1 family)